MDLALRREALNPKGIPQQSPGLRGTSYPGTAKETNTTLKGLRPHANEKHSMNTHVRAVRSRREFLQRAGCGFGAMAFSYMLGLDGLSSRAESIKVDPLNPLAPRPPHHPARAKSVI